jgi:hypothetical protein
VLLSLFVLLTKPITIPFNDSNQSHLKGSISVSVMCFQWLLYTNSCKMKFTAELPVSYFKETFVVPHFN